MTGSCVENYALLLTFKILYGHIWPVTSFILSSLYLRTNLIFLPNQLVTFHSYFHSYIHKYNSINVHFIIVHMFSVAAT